MPRYHCLIPDVPGNCVLVTSTSDGRWTLPVLEHDAAWFVIASGAIAHNASSRYGVSMTALREHSIGDCRACELEIQARDWTPPTGMRWIAHGDLDRMATEPAALRDILQAWFLERDKDAVPIHRAPWERRGWYAEATRWIEAQCARLGYEPSAPVEQVKAAWSLSSILRIKTLSGTLYFKADFARPPPEPAIIATLARRWPRNVPTIVAADHERGWMLMRDFGDHALDRAPFPRWQAAVRTFSAIQVACSANLEPWWQLNCPDFRIPALAAGMDRLLDDDTALGIGEADGLTTAEVDRLRQASPRLHAMWDELAAIPIPDSLVQQDFRHGNLVLSGRNTVFYDWSDTVISHPFFSACRFLDYLPHDGNARRRLQLEERERRITDAYLQPWANILGPDARRRAFALARRLNPVYVAIRRRFDVPWCEPSSSWGRRMREEPAREMRRLLMDLERNCA